ncbi:efflux RND transporter permease subunit [Sandaracinus amylolyticus]|uniref:RND multidrug efflux transporter n=1 Tax=Sandaracinus amylolyticus TaxID=927083 RepID=A0A0F6YGG5_9BACT|nr:efflux RND transporter permease subunit [Sandaracinus amylolyticus]AKF04663.1 RND multidrug efflux transporter [Sandaracinus amylolyticus]
MTLSDVAIKRPVFTSMISLGIIVLGVLGYSRLGVNLFPDVEFPAVTVTTVYPGASPAEMETQVTEKIEDAIVSLPGIDRIQSWSRDSVSNVVIFFELDVDPVEAATQVRERVAQIRAQLPREVEDPTVVRLDISAAPIMTYTLSGDADLNRLRDFAEDDIRPYLEQVDGVASVSVNGGRERQINVELDVDRLIALGMTPLSVVEQIQRENLSVPAGGFDEGDRRIAVRTLGELVSIDELRQLPVGTGADGSLVRLGDIGTVEDGFADQTTIVRSNGRPAVVFAIMKASGSNTVEISEGVRARLAELPMPAGVNATLVMDQAEFVLENAHEVQIALWFGGAMAILIILVFLMDLRSTFISALALPTSVLGAFFFMYLMGFTLNMMTLLGLSLAIGLLIDDSIVVRENIMKHLERGEDPEVAASKGTREITLAVLATTATLCAVFVPVAFTGGMVGQFFREFGLTIAAATVLSAWVAFTLDPMLSARLAKKIEGGAHAGHDDGAFGFIKRPLRGFYETLDSLYASLLVWLLGKKWRMAVVLFLAFACFVGSQMLVPLMGSEFTSAEDRGQFNVDIELPAGTRLEESARLSALAENELGQDPLFTNIYVRAGVNGAPNMVTWTVICPPKNERDVTQVELEHRTRDAILRHIPEAEIAISPPGIVEGGRDYGMELHVVGDDFASIAETANFFYDTLRGIPGTRDVDRQYSPGSPQLEVHVDRDRASQLHIPLALIARTARASIEGEVAGQYRDGDDEVDIRVRLRPEDRAHAGLIANLRIVSPGGFVPLSDLATVGRGEGPAEIQRSNRRRTIVVTASAEGRPIGDVLAEFEQRIADHPMPAGVSWELEGQAKMMNESNSNMAIALLLGIVFIYLVLASQFESLMHPVTIMMALPLAFVGAFVALFLSHSSMSMGATIGFILLMGLVTKNGILLIDHAVTKVREEGWSPHAAILDAGPSRMRPILMTSAAMVLGMLPTALNDGPGSEFRAPMAIGIIGGVISSTLLTLLVVPVFYLMMEGLRERTADFWVRWVLGRPRAPGGARKAVSIAREPEQPIADAAEE